MSQGPNKIFIKVESTAEQQENLKNSRKTLKVLQKTKDKENLVGREQSPLKGIFTKSKSETQILDENDIKRKKLVSLACQTDPEKKALAQITEDDLTTTGEPDETYWKILAEKRRIALDLSLKENEELHEQIISLNEELETSRIMLDETKNLVEVLTEMLQEDEGFEKGECSSDLINASIAEEAKESTYDDDVKIIIHLQKTQPIQVNNSCT